jgi:anti-sigma B factor antagonist
MPMATLVTIAGEVDIVTVPELRGHLLALPERSTVVEMSEVGLLSAAGLTVLLDLQDRLARADARVVLAAVPGCIRRVLAVTGLDAKLPPVSTVEEAVERVNAGLTQPAGPPAPLRAMSTQCRSAPRRFRSLR